MLVLDNSSDLKSSLDVRIWGPNAWEFMHAVTFSYPISNPSDEEQKNMRNFFVFIGNLLPCQECRYHFIKLLETTPPDVSSRHALSNWLVDRHNDVNVRLHKPTLSYDFVKRKYDNMHNQCPVPKEVNCGCDKKPSNHLQYVLLWTAITFVVLLVIAISIFVYTKWKA